MIRWLTWLGGHESAILIAAGAIAAGVLAFALLASEVMEGETTAFDRKVLLSLRRPSDLTPIGSPAIQEAARDVTALGSVTVLGLVTAITAGFLALDGKRRMAAFVCGSVVSGLVMSAILKDAFHRARPDLVPHAVYVSTESFPSGHSMMSAVTYLTLGALLSRSRERKRIKAYFLLLAVFLMLIVGLSRIYLGVHWPTDVLAGWTAGSVWALLCWVGARWLQGHRALERESEHASESA